jgi:hypothetical protein
MIVVRFSGLARLKYPANLKNLTKISVQDILGSLITTVDVV